MSLRYWRLRLRIAGAIHRQGSLGHEWRCRVAEWLHPGYRHGLAAITTAATAPTPEHDAPHE